MTKNTTRVQMELPEKSFELLKELKDKTDASSYAEVTKHAYRLYKKMIDLTESNNVIFIKNKDGTIKELEMFIN